MKTFLQNRLLMACPGEGCLVALLILADLVAAARACAATRYVDLNSPSPTPPYTAWVSAAHTIQEAVDAAAAGDTILVTNGIYRSGGLRVTGQSNRVAVTKPVTVASVHGPIHTVIEGVGGVAPSLLNTNAVRCVYLAAGATLTGFTLTNGSVFLYNFGEQVGGGLFCEAYSCVVSNCVLIANAAPNSTGGGAYGGTLWDCALRENYATQGGGAYTSRLYQCTILANEAQFGGGIDLCTASACVITSNSVYSASTIDYGGGATRSALDHCTLASNSSVAGGGAHLCTLIQCLLTNNTGGGASFSILNRCKAIGNFGPGAEGNSRLTNCLVMGNDSGWSGGGADTSLLHGCTVVSNSAAAFGGGLAGCTAVNCIVQYNTAAEGANYFDSFIHYSCTFPQPANGVGNITNEPAFVDPDAGNYRLRPDSSCIDAGTSHNALGQFDLDGNPRPLVGRTNPFGRFDMGAYEYALPAPATNRIAFNQRGSWTSPGSFANAVRVSGQYAYLAERSLGSPAGLQILDVSDSAHPFRVGGIDTGGYACDVEVNGGFAYVADFLGGLRIIDVSNPAQPVSVGVFDSNGCSESPHALQVAGGFAYIADGMGALAILDVRNPTSPRRVGGHDYSPSDRFARGVQVIGDRAYVAGGTSIGDERVGFMQVFDLSQPTNAVQGGLTETLSFGHGVAVSGNHAYVVGEETAMTVVDVLDPLLPISAGKFHTYGWAQAVQVAGDHLFVAGEFLGLAALDVRNPSHPIQVGHYPLGTGEDEGWDVHVVGNQAYLARGYHGLLVFEVVESPYIKSVRRSGNNLVLSWNGAPGLRLQRTPSLNSPAWTDVVESAGASEISLPVVAGGEFYRLANTPTNAAITGRR